MSASVLVTYATRYGSTQEVAEDIAATLRECGLKVDILPVREVQSLNGYSAVVLGAAFYYGSWNKDADRFLLQHSEALAKLPIAVFALGPILDPPNQAEWHEARKQLDKEMAKVPALRPIAVEMFGGKYAPSKLGFIDKIVTILPASPLKQMPPTDLRDWKAVRAWANDLASDLQSALAR
jgi:menaquinone-dependent protoporphyrinogen oxidase